MSETFWLSLIVGLMLAGIMSPSKSTVGASRWGRHLASLAVFVTTISLLWRYRIPENLGGGINAVAVWALCTVVLAVVAYLLGLLAHWLLRGAKRVSEVALPMSRDLAESSVATLKELADGGTKKCPYCAETIKRNAIYCRFCQHDVPSEPERVPTRAPHQTPKLAPLAFQTTAGTSQEQRTGVAPVNTPQPVGTNADTESGCAMYAMYGCTEPALPGSLYCKRHFR